jgi:hypothetical protein
VAHDVVEDELTLPSVDVVVLVYIFRVVAAKDIEGTPGRPHVHLAIIANWIC